MDLNPVSVFVRVVEGGSFTAAARSLDLPKSSVSRSVQHLEDSLGVRLLQRTTRNLNLTDAGRLYYDQARAALSQLDDARAAVTSMRAEPQGTVRITAPPDLGVIALPQILSDFLREYPKVNIDLSLSSRRVDLIQEGFDIALRAGAMDDSSLIARKISATELGLFASNAYLDRRGTPKRVEDLAEHECILFRGTNGRATWRLSGPDGDEKVEVSGRINADELSFVSRAIVSDLGIGLVPEFYCSQNPALVRVLPEHAVRGAQFSVVTPSARHQPAAVTLLREFLIRRLEAFPWIEAGEQCATVSPVGGRASKSKKRRGTLHAPRRT